jgi:hypothetical protein
MVDYVFQPLTYALRSFAARNGVTHSTHCGYRMVRPKSPAGV